MQHALSFPPPECLEAGPNPSFNVLIAYEDFETGKHAKRTYDFLVEHLGHDCHFNNQMWKFDVLSIPKLREMAAADAAGADIVVISCHGDDLPELVKIWIESWIDADDGPLALVALFDPPSEDHERTRAVRAYLADVARRAQMEFFAQPDEWPGKEESEPSVFTERSGDFQQRTLSTLAGAVRCNFPRPRWTFAD